MPPSFKDRNLESALFLRTWAELKPLQVEQPEEFGKIRERRLASLLKETAPIWKALQTSYAKDFAAALETETWVEARFYQDLEFRLPESMQQIQDDLQESKMPSLGDDDTFDCFQSLERFVGRAQGVTVRFRTSLEEKARETREGRAPSSYGGFAGAGALSMPDMENELYEMQQNLFASVLGGDLGMGGMGLHGLGIGGPEPDSDEEEEEEEEEEEDEEEEELAAAP